MNRDDDHLTDALRDGIDRMMGEVEIPAGLVSRARWHRNQQSRFKTVAGSAAALVGVVGLLAATLAVAPPELPGGQRSKILTVSYVTGRIERAMAQASADKRVMEITAHGVDAHFDLYLTGPKGVVGGRFPSLETSRIRLWFYRDQFRQQGLNSSGEPLWDAVSRLTSIRTHSSRLRGYAFDHQARTWWRARYTAPRPAPSGKGCKAGTSVLQPWQATPQDWAAIIHSALSCGSYKIVRNQHVDGQDATELVPARHAHNGAALYGQILWFSPSTYLPLRTEWIVQLGSHSDSHSQSHGDSHSRIVADFTWNKPTKAILAQLSPAVPGGFHKVGGTLSQELVTILQL
jgi:hypothetical protein